MPAVPCRQKAVPLFPIQQPLKQPMAETGQTLWAESRADAFDTSTENLEVDWPVAADLPISPLLSFIFLL
jgi:hypothetical protein